MTPLLVAALGVFFAYAIYIAWQSLRYAERADDFVDAGGKTSAWTAIFAAAGVVLASIGLYRHFLIIALDGLPYSHVALGLVLVALSGTLLQKRLWLAARISRIASPIELLGTYYGSVTVRLFAFAVLLLFAIPFAAHDLSLAGGLLATASGGAITQADAIWVLAFFLFLYSAIGGWRGVLYVIAMQSFLVVVLLVFVGSFSAGALHHAAFFTAEAAAPKAALGEFIPGVVQASPGIGAFGASGVVWTTLAILSFGLSLIGIVLSPAFSFLGMTTETKSGFAFTQVWLIAGLGSGLLLVVGPIIGADIASFGVADLAKGSVSYAGPLAHFAALDQFAAIALLLLLLTAIEIAVAFFAAAGANILTLDLVCRFMLPDLAAEGRRLAARILLAAIYAAVALMASFAPLWAAILASVTLSLSTQLLPALLGLCWVPWISRSAVITGLIAGTLLVLFTEPPGLILCAALFAPLPWGRWPFTIHSAAWGLGLNMAFVLLVAIVTRAGPERDQRQGLHDAFRRDFRVDFGGAGARNAKWSLPLIWTFLALGPGAIIGNDLFSHPFFGDAKVAPGVPSLFVWQILFWFIGVLLVWWLAYQGRMAVIDRRVSHGVELAPASLSFGRRRRPVWISLLLERLTERGR